MWHKKFKFYYFVKNFIRLITPHWMCQIKKTRLLSRLKNHDQEYIFKRVNYYNKLTGTTLSESSTPLSDFKFRGSRSAYFFDTNEFTRLFSKDLRVNLLFGDITYIPDEASIVKSRPIGDNNQNSVILNLDKFRHFTFIKDKRDFSKKKNLLVGRGHVGPRKPTRIKFLEKYFDHPMCDIGKTNKGGEISDYWLVDRMTIDEQLEYKFILCWEGNDVASNLKWVMSSNSIAVTPKPRYETWYMEGTLIPDYHYIAVNDDLSDLEEKLIYYSNHIEASNKIIANAHRYIQQFQNKEREKIISTLVLEKYFDKTGQKASKQHQ